MKLVFLRIRDGITIAGATRSIFLRSDGFAIDRQGDDVTIIKGAEVAMTPWANVAHATPLDSQEEAAEVAAVTPPEPVKRGRGRPKGSRNRPREDEADDEMDEAEP